MIGSIRRGDLSKELEIPAQFEILLVLALGKPKEIVVMDPVGPDGRLSTGATNSRFTMCPSGR